MQINYQSLTNTRVRSICPHSLGHDGYRWHVRAWYPEKAQYRDFVLGRILSCTDPKPYLVKIPEDLMWDTFVQFVLIAHPRLDDVQKNAIERDFRLDGGHRAITMRLALAYYFVRRHNLDLRGDEVSPERSQLFLKNYEEYIQFRQMTEGQSKQLGIEWQKTNPTFLNQ
jgi:predicted DNA-binding transcriptional regulator YafY